MKAIPITGLNECALRDAATCVSCQRKIGEGGRFSFYVLTLERHFVDLNAVRRQSGLEALVGSVRIAQAMGPGEEMTMPIGGRLTFTICEDCSTKTTCVAQLAEEATNMCDVEDEP